MLCTIHRTGEDAEPERREREKKIHLHIYFHWSIHESLSSLHHSRAHLAPSEAFRPRLSFKWTLSDANYSPLAASDVIRLVASADERIASGEELQMSSVLICVSAFHGSPEFAHFFLRLASPIESVHRSNLVARRNGVVPMMWSYHCLTLLTLKFARELFSQWSETIRSYQLGDVRRNGSIRRRDPN